MAKVFIVLAPKLVAKSRQHRRAANIQAGGIVKVEADSYSPKPFEELPYYGIITVTGTNTPAFEPYMQPWSIELSTSVLSENSEESTVQLEIANANQSAQGEGKLADYYGAMRRGLSRVNGLDINPLGSNVTVDFEVGNVLLSEAFWKAEEYDIGFTELSYDPVEGVHEIELDYTLSPLKNFVVERVQTEGEIPKLFNANKQERKDALQAEIAQLAEAAGATVTSNTWPICIVDISRQVVVNTAVADISNSIGTTELNRRRYRMPRAVRKDCAFSMANDQEYSMTFGQFKNKIVDSQN